MSRRFAALALFALGLLLSCLPAAALQVPQLWGRIVDEAQMLDGETAQRIETELAAVEAATGAQIAVLTIPSLEGESLEAFSILVVESWQLGREKSDDGVLFLIARDDRLMRLEIGYGLEETLTDATTGRILDNLVRPRFRAGDFAGGIEAGAHAVAELVQGRELPAEALADPGSGSGRGFNPVVLFIGFILLQIFAAVRGRKGWILYGLGFPLVLLVSSALWGLPIAIGLTLAWAIMFPIQHAAAGRTGKGGRWSSGGGGGGWSSGGGGWSSGGGGGGFSGGGGSFGGGGSSSSW